MNIRELRKTLRLSQEELAKRAGTSREFISQLERGVRPVPQSVRVLLNGLAFLTDQAERSADDAH